MIVEPHNDRTCLGPTTVERVERADMRAAVAAIAESGTPANGAGPRAKRSASSANGAGPRAKRSASSANGAGPRVKRAASSAIPAAGKPPANTSGTSPPDTAGAPFTDPAVQFQQIMAALTPEERMKLRYVVTRLSMGDLMQWYEQLARMPVAEGVATIRADLAPTEQTA